ncbi:MAG: hypothetical protein A2W21_08070 [Betaproteobacteria bacterium RBG_16_66_20]|nr:MAG: hypothetical protein A2W21_08070 [Betaproteobacteria bacterium RBG_16_66_20]
MKFTQDFLRALMLSALLVPLAPQTASAGGPPGPAEINGQKVLTLVSRDPPGVRCNNNIQVAAELSNIYKIPVVVVPAGFAGPGAKAPAVYYGRDMIAEDGGAHDGMVSYSMVADVLEIEDARKHQLKGRLFEVKKEHDSLKNAIKTTR